jgi:hypothetical protein
MRSRALASTAFMLILAPLAVGCTGPHTASGPESDSVQIRNLLDEATKRDASEHQIAVLNRALKVGTVTRADMDEAFADSLQCLDDAGLTYRVFEDQVSPGSGLTVPNVSVVMPPGRSESEMDTLGNIANTCLFSESIYVVSTYADQASSQEIQDAAWKSDSMRACLKERGFDVPEDATVDEISQAYTAEMMSHSGDANYPGPCE